MRTRQYIPGASCKNRAAGWIQGLLLRDGWLAGEPPHNIMSCRLSILLTLAAALSAIPAPGQDELPEKSGATGMSPLPEGPPPAVEGSPAPAATEVDEELLPEQHVSTEETDATQFIIEGYRDPIALPERPGDTQPFFSLFPAEVWGTPQPEQWAVSDRPPAIPNNPGQCPPLTLEQLKELTGGPRPPLLSDPHGLLSPAELEGLNDLVKDGLNVPGEFETTVLLLAPQDEVLTRLNPQEVLSRWHPRGKGLLLLLFAGQPARTQAFFTPDVLTSYQDRALREVMDAGVKEFTALPGEVPRIQRFLYMTAARLHHAYEHGQVVVVADTQVSQPRSSTGLIYAGLAAAGAGALAWGGIALQRRRRLVLAAAQQPLHFPEQEPATRLGGPHCGGFAVTMPFGPARL